MVSEACSEHEHGTESHIVKEDLFRGDDAHRLAAQHAALDGTGNLFGPVYIGVSDDVARDVRAGLVAPCVEAKNGDGIRIRCRDRCRGARREGIAPLTFKSRATSVEANFKLKSKQSMSAEESSR